MWGGRAGLLGAPHRHPKACSTARRAHTHTHLQHRVEVARVALVDHAGWQLAREAAGLLCGAHKGADVELLPPSVALRLREGLLLVVVLVVLRGKVQACDAAGTAVLAQLYWCWPHVVRAAASAGEQLA
jgi:hypothetical protein